MTGPGRPDDRPRWSLTWLFRLQRTGRDRVERTADQPPDRPGFRWFMWLVIALLAIEIAIGIWHGWLPR